MAPQIIAGLWDDLLVEFAVRLRRLDRSPATIMQYTSTSRRFLHFYERLSLDALTGEHVEHYLYARPLAARSMSSELAALRTFFHFLVKGKRLLTRNPCDGVEKPRWVQKTRPSPTWDDFTAIARSCTSPEEHALVHLIYFAGLRVSEVRGIRWGDIDLERRRVHVLGKGRKVRTAPFPQHVGPLLEAIRCLTPDRFNTPPAPGVWFLFPSRQYATRSRQPWWIEKTFRAIGERAGLRYRLTCHILGRYGFARLGRTAGLSLHDVSFLMGHADIRTTANVYSRLQIEDVQPAYDRAVAKFLEERA